MRRLASLLTLVLFAVPPLSESEQARLASAVDDLDGPDDALAALLEHCSRWTGGPGDAPIRLEPDLQRMLDDPAAYRGALCRLRGRVQQQTPLQAPHAGALEWIVRDADGRPILVYLPEDPKLTDGTAIEIDARFYKRVRATARDGVTRVYPAFVGSKPVTMPIATTGAPLTVIVPVIVMFMVFLALLVYARRGGRRPARGWRVAGPVDEAVENLPADPAEALEELRRRAEDA